MGEFESTEDYLTLEPLRTRIEAHLLYSEQPEDVEQAVLDAIVLKPGNSLLDVGCGTGSFLRRLRSEGHVGRLVGLDTSPAAIEALHSLEAVEAVQADAAAWSRTVLSGHGIDLSRRHGLPMHSGNLPDLMTPSRNWASTASGTRFDTGRQSSTIS